MNKVPTTIRAASVLLVLCLGQALPAQDRLILHGADILDSQEHIHMSPETVSAPDDFRSRTPILQRAVRRNLRTNSSDRYRHSVAMYRGGKKLDYFPASEEHRAPLSKVEPELRTSGSGFNWSFTIFFLGVTFILWRAGNSPRAPGGSLMHTRADRDRTSLGPMRISGLHSVVPSTSSGTHTSPRRQ